MSAILIIDQDESIAFLNGEQLDLARKEQELLLFMAAEPERMWTKKELLEHIWGYGFGGNATLVNKGGYGDVTTRTLDSHACRLRKKLGGAGWIVNTWGRGYRLRAAGQGDAVFVRKSSRSYDAASEILRRARELVADVHSLAVDLDDEGNYALAAITTYSTADALRDVVARLQGVKDTLS